MSSSPGASTSSDVPFTPRKEFIRDHAAPSSSFALLALSSANCIRLYSFTPQAVTALRALFDQSVILSYREDTEHNLLEFALNAKPWANPKSVPTEKLLVDIMAIIYQCGYQYRSTIDYGREADDRLAMVFSRYNTPQTTPTSPPPTVASHVTLLDNVKLVPFAISFSSVTVMRVISPPLHLTPAILQAVRGSWPRGVVSEKKVGDNSYEFKLKGYRWFQQDTFASDSLQHILTLLTSLDAQSFTLLTSISLTNRSRVKDLWIFTGPAAEGGSDTPPLAMPLGALHGDLASSPTSPLAVQHRRYATEPVPNQPYSPTHQHARAGSEGPQSTRVPSPRQGAVLRKPAPRAQVPVSVARDSFAPDVEQPMYRAHMPSTISDDAVNMTGVGASPNVFYATSPFSPGQSSGQQISSPPVHPFSPQAERTVDNPPPTAQVSPPAPQQANGNRSDMLDGKPATSPNDISPRPLLAAGVFRDSNFSGNSELSYDIPVKWTGPLKEELEAAQVLQANQQRDLPASGLLTPSTPLLPGGWQPTPIDERPEEMYEDEPVQTEQTTTPIHEMLSRIESPEVVGPVEVRKSETALVGLIQETSPLPPVPPLRQKSLRSPKDESKASPPLDSPGEQGRGWILVNVDDSGHTNGNAQSGPPMAGQASSARVPQDDSPGPIPPPAMASPSAKAIAVIDAMDAKHKKTRSQSASKDGREGGSGVRRFFSLNRKTTRKAAADEDGADHDNDDTTSSHTSSIPRSNLRDRLRRMRTPEASRREDKRRSID